MSASTHIHRTEKHDRKIERQVVDIVSESTVTEPNPARRSPTVMEMYLDGMCPACYYPVEDCHCWGG